MQKTSYNLLGLAAASCCFLSMANTCSLGQTNVQKEIKPYVVITGADSHIAERQCFRVSSNDEWTALWLRHKGKESSKKYDDYFNPAGVPNVNFENCMVIAIFKGPGSNSAGLRAVSVHEDPEAMLFRFRDMSYQSGNWSDKVTVYGFFVLPRSTMPVVLEEDVQGIINKPPVWRERARFEKLPEKHQ